MQLVLILHTLSSLPSAWAAGYATNATGYPNGGGVCGFPGEEVNSFPFGMYAAVDKVMFDSGKTCGGCYEVQCVGMVGNDSCQCANETVVVMVDGDAGDRTNGVPRFELNNAAMSAIVEDMEVCSTASIRYRQVICAYEDDGMNIKLLSRGLFGQSYGFYVIDVAGDGIITKARVRSYGSYSWIDCLLSNAYYYCTSGVGYTLPLTVELTDSNGVVLTGTDVVKDGSNGTWDFGTNFGRSQPNNTGNTTSVPATWSPTVPSTLSPPTPSPKGSSSSSGLPIWAWAAIGVGAVILIAAAVSAYRCMKAPKKEGVYYQDFIDLYEKNGPAMDTLSRSQTAYHESHSL